MDMKKLASMGTALGQFLGFHGHGHDRTIILQERRNHNFRRIAQGNYVLHKVIDGGRAAIYRHPTKKGPGRQIIIKA